MNSTDRVQKLRGMMTEKEIEGIFVSQPENRFYLSGFNGSAGYLFITDERAVLATDFRYVEQSKAQAPDYEVFQISGKVEDWFPRLVGGANVRRLGFEGDNLTASSARQLADVLSKTGPGMEFVSFSGVVESIRVVKEPGEIDLISRAVRISDDAISHVIEWIRPGMTERQVAWEIERSMRENGSESVPFEVLVQSGPNSALPHAQPSDRKINAGEPIVMDIGAKVGGYASDLTRTICVGEPDDTFRKIYDIVLAAQLAGLELIKEGMTGEAADNLARIIIKEAGHGDAFGHSLGHGVGLAVHENPRLGPNSSDILKNGMVFSVEPGIYLTGWGGVRIEDLVTLDKGKVRTLSQAPKIEK